MSKMGKRRATAKAAATRVGRGMVGLRAAAPAEFSGRGAKRGQTVATARIVF
jgi:hypothetical protein